MTRPHRRTRPLPFGAVPWETSPHTARIGVDQAEWAKRQDAAVAAMGEQR